MSLNNIKAGEISPSQLMFTYGVGALVDLPHLTALVMGLQEWSVQPGVTVEIIEPRLLNFVRANCGASVQRLQSLPYNPADDSPNPFNPQNRVGVPITVFPRWLVCPACKQLGRVGELFQPASQTFPPDRIHYEHTSCNVAQGKKPPAVAARILATCERGHLDDFPWIEYLHRGRGCERPSLKLEERGASGGARDLWLKCDSCNLARSMADAFDPDQRDDLPACRAFHPHLLTRDAAGCLKEDGSPRPIRAIVLGASNLWFPLALGAIALPTTNDTLSQFVLDQWGILQKVTSLDRLELLYELGQIPALADYSPEQVWQEIERKRARDAQPESAPEQPDLKTPEYQALITPAQQLRTDDFQLRAVEPPPRYRDLISQVVLVEKMREVRALVGFTRLESIDQPFENDEAPPQTIAPLTREELIWVPAIETRGEGIFLRVNEDRIQAWLQNRARQSRTAEFREAHQNWRRARGIQPPEANFPLLRYVLLHTLAHALMRHLAIECGYSQASLRERIYSATPDDPNGPRAGILIYTAASDSEGTLGGLVSQGESARLEYHLAQTLRDAGLCSSDPTCAEHIPGDGQTNIHGAACHSCLFAPETSCERGNRYLDRSVLVSTFERSDLAFFTP